MTDGRTDRASARGPSGPKNVSIQYYSIFSRLIQKMHFGVIGPRSLGGMSQTPKKEVLLKKFFRILLIRTAPGGQRFSRFEVKLYTPYTDNTSQLNAKQTSFSDKLRSSHK